MGKSSDSGAKTSKVESMLVPYRDIITEADDWAFRDNEVYQTESKPILTLAESIKVQGQLTPMRCKRVGDKYLLTNGHRRHAAMGKLVKEKSGGWDSATLVKVEVYADDVNEDQMLLDIGNLNNSLNLDDLGLIRYATKLDKRGIPKATIVIAVGKSEKQVERYIKIGSSEWVIELLKDHTLNTTAAGKLLDAAVKAKCEEELADEIRSWAKAERKKLKKVNQTREENDKKLLTGSKLWPSTYLTTSLVESWIAGCDEKNWKAPKFRYQAGISEDITTKRLRLEIDGFKGDVDTTSLEDMTKIYARFKAAAKEMEPHLLDKKLRREAAKSRETGMPSDEGAKAAAALGLAEYLDSEVKVDGEDDPNYDEIAEREEVDLSDRVELPGDDDGDDSDTSGDDDSED